MTKWKLNVEETVHYMHEIKVETDLNEEQLDAALDKVQAKLRYPNNLDDVIEEIGKEGVKVTDYTRDEDGQYGDIEIEDMEEVEE